MLVTIEFEDSKTLLLVVESSNVLTKELRP